MICMGMCGNGAGTGTEVTQAMRRRILWARPRGLSAWIAAGAGAIQPGTCVPRTGATATRTVGAAILASGLSAPSLTGSGRVLKSLWLFS